jgi:hypothetical protein
MANGPVLATLGITNLKFQIPDYILQHPGLESEIWNLKWPKAYPSGAIGKSVRITLAT